MHIQERFERNDLPDIIMATYMPEGSIQKETLLDLSGYGFVQNYKASILSNLSVEGGGDLHAGGPYERAGHRL